MFKDCTVTTFLWKNAIYLPLVWTILVKENICLEPFSSSSFLLYTISPLFGESFSSGFASVLLTPTSGLWFPSLVLIAMSAIITFNISTVQMSLQYTKPFSGAMTSWQLWSFIKHIGQMFLWQPSPLQNRLLSIPCFRHFSSWVEDFLNSIGSVILKKSNGFII